MSLCKKRLCWGLIIMGLLGFIVAVVLLVQPYLFFYPWHDETACEALRQKDAFTELRIPHRGGQLHGWLRKNSEEEKGPLLLFFGGNGQNASNTMQILDGMHHFSYFENHHVLFVDYPGYGLSDGRPSESSLFAAALEVYDYASELDCVDRERISVLGYSIGTGVANYVATQRNIQGLILLAPYDRGLSLYNDALNIFHGPLKHLARFQFDSLSYAREIELAPLIVASRDDEVIPYPLALNLAEGFPHTPETVLLDQLSHDGFLYDSRVMEAIHSYLVALS